MSWTAKDQEELNAFAADYNASSRRRTNKHGAQFPLQGRNVAHVGNNHGHRHARRHEISLCSEQQFQPEERKDLCS
jgi:hypothetical protein